MGVGPNDVRVCVAGCGYWGKNLIRNFHALGNLHSVCESDATRLEQFRAQYQVQGFTTLDGEDQGNPTRLRRTGHLGHMQGAGSHV